MKLKLDENLGQRGRTLLAAAGHDSRARRETVDAAAAAVLLEAALESERRTGAPPGDLVAPRRPGAAR